jgi:hypothetical protein
MNSAIYTNFLFYLPMNCSASRWVTVSGSSGYSCGCDVLVVMRIQVRTAKQVMFALIPANSAQVGMVKADWLRATRAKYAACVHSAGSYRPALWPLSTTFFFAVFHWLAPKMECSQGR